MGEDAAVTYQTEVDESIERILPAAIVAHLAVGRSFSQVQVNRRVHAAADLRQQFQGALL